MPLFPLRIKAPIYLAGFNAWRVLNGKRVRHQAQDYTARQWEVYAPEDGKVIPFWDKEGGWMINFIGQEYDYQLAHHSKNLKSGLVRRGDLIAISGATGTNQTGPHLHLAVKTKGGFWIDPLKINWEEHPNSWLAFANVF